jgi:serine/threonine protein kinase
MTHTDITNDLAFDLYARWEDEKALGKDVSLEEICAAHPELMPDVREIARRLSSVAALFPAAPGRDDPCAGSATGLDARRPPDWIEIGSGASSIVYRGHDPTFGTAVAYKVLHAQDRLLSSGDVVRLMKRFEQEARILARLKHDGIVRIFKTFVLDGRPVLEMEYLPGGSLVTHLEAVRAQGAAGIARFMERVARAVGFAHEHGIVHRDLKPSNILLNEENLPCVSDFGIAKLLGPTLRDPGPEQRAAAPSDGTAADAATLTAHGHQPGTRAYMAPEQFDPELGEISPATDVWSLGVILYELLSARRPFSGGTFAEWKTSVCDADPEWPGRSRWRAFGRLERIARRCLSRDPTCRYRSATELAAALGAVIHPTRWKMPLAAGAALGLVPLAAVLLFQPGTPPDRSDQPTTTNGNPQPEALPKSDPDPPKEAPPEVKPPAWVNLKTAAAIVKRLERLEHGESVVVCGDGSPLAYRPVFGSPNVRPSRGPDGRSWGGPVMLHCSDEGAVELIPRLPPRGRFLVRAVLRHVTADTNMSLVGIFAGGTGWWADEGSGYRCLVAGFSDRGLSAGHQRVFGLHVVAPTGETPSASARALPPAPGQPNPPSGRRVIEFDVNDGTLEVRLDGVSQAVLTDSDLSFWTRLDFPPKVPPGKLSAPPSVRGAVGVYTSGGYFVVERMEVSSLSHKD